MGLDNPLHILLLLIVVLLVFGAKRLPEIGRSLGDGMRGFKDSLQGDIHPAVSHQHAPEAVGAPPVTPIPAYAPTAPAPVRQPVETGL
jgi:sec-independent protein translocase protein TatA